MIVIVPINEDVSLFLYGYNKKGELVFKSSRNLEHMQNEIIIKREGMCYTSLYHFPVRYLDNLPEEPVDIQ